MENKINESPISKLINKNFEKIKRLEKVGLVIFGIGFLLYCLKIPRADGAFIFGAVYLAITYFLFGFKIPEIKDTQPNDFWNSIGFVFFINKATCWSLSISAMAIISLVTYFKDGQILMRIGSSGLELVTFFALIANFKGTNKVFNFTFFLRIIIAFLFLAFLAITKYKMF